MGPTHFVRVRAFSSFLIGVVVVMIAGCPIENTGPDIKRNRSTRLTVPTDRDCVVLGAVMRKLTEHLPADITVKLVRETLPESQQRFLHNSIVAEQWRDEFGLERSDIERFSEQLQLSAECGLNEEFIRAIEFVSADAAETSHAPDVVFVGFSAPIHMVDNSSVVVAWTSGIGESMTAVFEVKEIRGDWKVTRERIIAIE